MGKAGLDSQLLFTEYIDQLKEIKTTIFDPKLNKTERGKKEIVDDRNKLQTIMDTIQDGLSVQDLDYNILYHNHVATDLFGDCVGKKCYKAYESNENICDDCPVELAYKDGKIHTVIKELRMLHSEEFSYWENVATPIRNPDGKIVACIEIATNITERGRAKVEIRQIK